MIKRYFTPTLTNKEGYYIISPQCYRGEISVSNDYVFDGWKSYKIGSKAFNSIEEAKAKAEQMRQKKIASLKQQIAKLESLNFS